LEKPIGRDHFGDLDLDGRILKWLLKQIDGGRLWIEYK
jgi:hypothetical protein